LRATNVDEGPTSFGAGIRFPAEIKCRHVGINSSALGDNVVNQPKWKTFYLDPPAIQLTNTSGGGVTSITPGPRSTMFLKWFMPVSDNWPVQELMDDPGFSTSTFDNADPGSDNKVS